MSKFLVIALALLVMSLSACGDSASTDVSEPAGVSAEEEPLEAAPPKDAELGDWARLKRLAGKYPDVVIPRGPAPQRKVVIRDLKLGGGPVLQKGDVFFVRWMSFDYKSGNMVEDTWDSHMMYVYGRHVEAWIPGFKGMRIGGVRELIAPASLTYGRARIYVVQLLGLV